MKLVLVVSHFSDTNCLLTYLLATSTTQGVLDVDWVVSAMWLCGLAYEWEVPCTFETCLFLSPAKYRPLMHPTFTIDTGVLNNPIKLVAARCLLF